ncbi:MAG: hypothetical protein RLY43_3 [Bacteroidota bacterium]|jgi:hypothetical protein
MITLTLTGDKYKYLYDILVKEGYPPEYAFVNGTTYTFNFSTQEIADYVSSIADSECNEAYKIDKINESNQEYAEKFLTIDRALLRLSIDSSRTSEEKTAAIAELSTKHSAIKSELLTKQGVVMNG